MAKKEQSLAEKLNYIQANLKVKKEKVNNFGKYKYRNLEDIFEGLKPLLKATGCIITISDEIKEVNGFNYICATVTLSDENTNIKVNGWARESVTKKGMDDSQITGSTSSYARKYACNGLFAIDDTADADSMDNRDQTHHNGAEVKGDGFITIEQSLKMERMSRDRYTMPNDAAMLKSIAKDGYAITAAEAQIHINAVLAGQEQNKPVSKSQKEDLIGELESLKKDKRINKEVYKNMTGYLEESNYSHKAVASVVDGINKVKKEGEVKNGK